MGFRPFRVLVRTTRDAEDENAQGAQEASEGHRDGQAEVQAGQLAASDERKKRRSLSGDAKAIDPQGEDPSAHEGRDGKMLSEGS